MKPLILDYAEIPEKINLDYSLIEYSEKLNLSVLKGTDEVAIDKANLDTRTFTKATGESSDSDASNMNLNNLFDTITKTGDNKESSDSDCHSMQDLQNTLDTKTQTYVQVEETDRDNNNFAKLKLLMDTRTLTDVAREQTDKDK